MDAHRNFAISAVAVAPSPASTGLTLTISTGDNALIPAVPFQAVTYPAGTTPTAANAEIVRVTAMTGDNVTAMLRAQEGTTARNIAVGDVFNVAITKKWLDDIESAIAAAAPLASPVHTGVVVAPSISGGVGAANSILIRPSTVATIGTIDLQTQAAPTFRMRGTDGHIVIGTDTTTGITTIGANCTVAITSRDSTITFQSWPTPVGIGLNVVGSTARPDRVAAGLHGNDVNIQSIFDIDNGTGGDGAEHIAILGICRNWDATYNGCSVALQGYGYANVNTSDGLHAGTGACLPFGADIKGRVESTVTDASHPAISGIETGGYDNSLHRQTNIGSGVRITNQGNNDIRNALVISNTPNQMGSWENGIVIGTGVHANLADNWKGGQVYGGGEMVADTVASAFYLCTTAISGSGTRPALDSAHWVLISNHDPQPWVGARDHAVHTVVSASGALWVCAVTHGPSYGTSTSTNPSLDRWNGFNGTAGPTGAASATASAGHWNLWTNDVGVVPHYTNTSISASTKFPGYYFWVGALTGSSMAANVPAGAPLFSVNTDGNLVAGGNIGFNGQTAKALTGWVAPTGTASRATFDIATVTLAGLAGRVAALELDLIANGVIG